MKLNEIQVDYIQEMFNIGLGDAASELSELVQHEVHISVPKFTLLTRDALIETLNLDPDSEVMTVSVELVGELGGNGMLIFPTGNSLSLVQTIVGDTVSDDGLTELEAEVLTEVGGIILNQIISTIASLLKVSVKTQLPVSNHTSIHSALYQNSESQMVIFVGMSFWVEELSVHGDILFLQSDNMVEVFVQEVDKILEELGI
ncbi:hypothetical protein OPW41_10595 [Vibrio europaeus]|uniref:Chemotaxis protein CheC n=1 Tax=Vibrio europaeus TaxID=300876 RepID=A0A178J4H8_9VIBR|nr:hypothetical protein [Vibrio europaeus]MDC5706291.1 hypothetical protein [Vibrio europaeus]MDC5709701.1 hypothetical protein [Vibrio europaeus]MDC5714100.1 hypothetical protein [Vibrio europaeus]MDC5720840.1 hypothetical protein [Vibrio europaeus]MDC5723291.1 hypothetical protein [Vibrio europaeus]